MTLLAELREGGFRVSAREGLLFVEPRTALTDEIRRRIRGGKAELLEALGAEYQAGLDTAREFKAALLLGRLHLCANCSHFIPGPGPLDIGHCQCFDVESFPLVPFECSGFRVSPKPQVPQLLPDPDGAGARHQQYAK